MTRDVVATTHERAEGSRSGFFFVSLTKRKSGRAGTKHRPMDERIRALTNHSHAMWQESSSVQPKWNQTEVNRKRLSPKAF